MRKNIVGTSLILAAGIAVGLGVRAIPQSAQAAAPPTAPAVAAAPITSPTQLQADPNIYVNLSKQVTSSVVNISTVTLGPAQTRGAPDEMFRRYFEDFFGHTEGGPGYRGGYGPRRRFPPPSGSENEPAKRIPRAASLGTGFVIDPSGVILTNNHVVANADEIKIAFTEDPKEKPLVAKVIGRDPDLDVALIRVETKQKLKAIPLGDSDQLEVGEYVAAIGNPFGQGHSLTHGIISAKGRQAPEYPLGSWLQTDAPINPGNSGGPLINLKGEVIGINTAIDARAHGIGFAIPINLVKKVLGELESKGKVARGYLGVSIADLNPDLAEKIGVNKEIQAPLVTGVFPKSPAAVAGVQPYDVILEFDGRAVQSGAELTSKVTSVAVGKSVPIKISRHGVEKTLQIKLGERPGVEQASRPMAPEQPDELDEG